eukprot:1089921-Amphidinium_carterae.2
MPTSACCKIATNHVNHLYCDTSAQNSLVLSIALEQGTLAEIIENKDMQALPKDARHVVLQAEL